MYREVPQYHEQLLQQGYGPHTILGTPPWRSEVDVYIMHKDPLDTYALCRKFRRVRDTSGKMICIKIDESRYTPAIISKVTYG